MDYFTATPELFRTALKVMDMEKYESWLTSEDLDAPLPTISKIFVVYSKGPGTPVPVQIEVERIETEYEDNLPTEEEFNTLTTNEYVDKARRVEMLLRRNLLLAVVKGLDVDSANSLSAVRDGEGHELLRRAGWLQTKEELEAVAKSRREALGLDSGAENKEEGDSSSVDETGESTSLISLPSTQE